MNLRDYFTSFSRFPVVPIVSYPVARLLNLDLRKCLLEDPRLHADFICRVGEMLEIDAYLPLLDLTVEAELFGAKVDFSKHEAPRINNKLDIDEIHRIERTRIPLMVETARVAADKKLPGKPLGFYVTGPLTVLSQILGVERVMLHFARRSERIFLLLDSITDVCVEYARRLADAGVDFLMIADPASSLLSVGLFRIFSMPYLERLIKEISTDLILHICGKAGHLLEDISELGATGISIDQNVQLEEASSKLPKEMLIFGNYNPVNILLKSPKEIEEDVFKMLEHVRCDRRIVASTGCDIPPTAPIENINAFIRASKSMLRHG